MPGYQPGDGSSAPSWESQWPQLPQGVLCTESHRCPNPGTRLALSPSVTPKSGVPCPLDTPVPRRGSRAQVDRVLAWGAETIMGGRCTGSEGWVSGLGTKYRQGWQVHGLRGPGFWPGDQKQAGVAGAQAQRARVQAAQEACLIFLALASPL